MLIWAERAESPRLVWGVVLAAVVALTVVSALDPALRFVDFLQFSDRAQGLRVGAGLSHPLYPVGYPAMLSLLQALTGDVLVGGRVLSVLGGALAVLAAARLLGPWVGIWLLVQLQTLIWGATEGTDILACGLGLGAIAAVQERRVWVAGALAGAACMVRYTGLAVVPIVVLAGGWRPLVSWALVVLPQVGLTVASDGPWLDQGSNMAIGGPGRHHNGPLTEWLHGVERVLPHAVGDWPTRIGLVGLAVGLARGDRRAWLLALWAVLYVSGLALAFANPRLALPVSSALALGAFWLIPRRWLGLAALGVAIWSVPRALDPPPEAVRVRAAVAAAEPGRYLSSDPWFHTRVEGWLVPATPVWVVGDAHGLTAERIRAFALDTGHTHLVLDQARAGRSPGLRALMAAPADGFSVVSEAPGQVVLRVD